MLIDFNVKNQTLECVSEYRAAEGSQNYIKCRFKFSKDWDGLTKSAIIICRSMEEPIIIYTDENDCFYIPQALTGLCHMSLAGTDGNMIITTNIITLALERTLPTEGAVSADDPQSDFSELIKKVNALKTELALKADKSELGIQDGGITTEKLADMAVTCAKIGSDLGQLIESKLSKAQASEAFDLKANKSDVYTKDETNEIISGELGSRIIPLGNQINGLSGVIKELRTDCDGKADKTDVYTKVETDSAIDERIGDIDTALDGIIALQNSLIGGGTA